MNPLQFGTIWKTLIAAVSDGGRTLMRTAFSEALREARDFSVGLFDAEARMIVQGDFSPAHLGAMPSAVKHVLSYYNTQDMRPGDGYVVNDLYMGSGHLCDFFLITPIFHDGRIIGFAVSCAHMIDVGGAVPGSQAVEGISDHYQEGIRFLPTRFWDAGEPSPELFRTLEANVRVPRKLVGDLQAMSHCNQSVAKRVIAVVENYGFEDYSETCDQILLESERAMTQTLERLGDRSGTAVDYFDDYGPDTEPLRIELAITVEDGHLAMDFEGSSPQTRSGINGIANYVNSYCYFVVKAATDSAALPQNEGSIKPITIRSPEGCIVNATPPSGGGARGVMQQRVVDVVFQAMSQVIPEGGMAAGSHWSNPTLSRETASEDDEKYVHYDVIVGGFGGRYGMDGLEAMSNSFNVDSIPIEVTEQSMVMLIEEFSFIPDSAGPGQYRGGHGVRKRMLMLEDQVHVSNLGDRQLFGPPGILGGGEGQKGKTFVNPGTESESLVHSKGSVTLRKGDTIQYDLAGAGGYGDPLRRAPEAIAEDIDEGLLSLERAAAVYDWSPDVSGEEDGA